MPNKANRKRILLIKNRAADGTFLPVGGFPFHIKYQCTDFCLYSDGEKPVASLNALEKLCIDE